ncbi:MAG: hypothetical protein IH600_12890 [Bacteroidetes bacterium]|nr:hypothetical protein [Bacteroidota bacterium]
MKRAILSLLLVLLLGPDATFSQNPHSEYGLAIIIRKYDRTIEVWSRTRSGGELIPAQAGTLYRSFPTGPKMIFADQRIPEGIYDGRIDADGNISFVFHCYPDMPSFDETYRITGASLARNVIPVKGDFIEELRGIGIARLENGLTSIPVVILPGTLEPEVAEMLENARNVKEGQSLDDVKESVTRWRPVEDYLIRAGRIPSIRFDEEKIIIEADEESPPALVNR